LGCSSPTEPDNTFPTDVASYHYTTVLGKRFYEIAMVPDSCYFDSIRGDTVCADTLLDSLVRVYDSAGIFWAESFRGVFAYVVKPNGDTVRVYESATRRREGRIADSLLLNPSQPERLLVAPLVAGRSWFVDQAGAITARIVGEETLPLRIGMTRTWKVERGAVGAEWYAPGLGRVQYEEINRSGKRIHAQLIALGSI
jgi:hypothetical protein